MSLPRAAKSTEEHPPKGSVTQPVDPKLKAADIDRKLRLYGVIQGFREGKMPDNKQIDDALQYAHQHSPVNTANLSPAGKKLIDDVRDIIETMRLMVKEKNADELFQGFVWDTRATNWSSHGVTSADAPVDKQTVKQDADNALEHLRTLLHLLLTNAEARKLLTDSGIIGRDLLAIGASKAAGMLAPTDEELRRVDQAAPDNKFITPEGTDKPVLEGTIPGTDHKVTSHPQQGVAVHTSSGQTKDTSDLKSDAYAIAGQVESQARQHGEDVRRDVTAAPDAEGQKGEAAKQSLKEKFTGFKDNLLDRIPQERKDQANDQYDKGRSFFTEEYFPPERRDQFIYRAKKVVVECQQHPEYQKSLTWLLDAIENYATHGKAMANTAQAGSENLVADPGLDSALTQFRTLVERFANNQSLEPILDAIRTLGKDAKEDEGLRNWLREVDTYIRRVLMEPGFVLHPDSDRRARELKDNGRIFWDDKYKTHIDNVFDQIGSFFGAMGKDPMNKRFGEDWARLSRDLLFDAEGKLTFKPELWNDIRKVILPEIIERVGYVPIPRIEYTDDAMDLVVENLTLSGPNLFPNVVTMETHNFMKFSPYSTVKDEMHHDMTLTFAQVQADLRDVAFSFKRKVTPRVSDSGLADIVLGGTGLTVSVNVRSAPSSDASSVFYVKSVDAKLGDVKVAIRDSKHDLLYKTIKPLMMTLVKKQIKKAIEDGVRTALEYLDGQLVTVQTKMNEAKSSDDTNRIQVLQEMFKRKEREASSVKAKADSHFQFVTKPEKMLLPDQGHTDASMIKRAGELNKTVGKGETWHSEAFTIVRV